MYYLYRWCLYMFKFVPIWYIMLSDLWFSEPLASMSVVVYHHLNSPSVVNLSLSTHIPFLWLSLTAASFVWFTRIMSRVAERIFRNGKFYRRCLLPAFLVLMIQEFIQRSKKQLVDLFELYSCICANM